MDLKSIGVSPRRFESCRLRNIFLYKKSSKIKIICPWKHFVDVVVEVYVIYAIMMLTVHTDGLDYDTSLCVRIACVYAGYMHAIYCT